MSRTAPRLFASIAFLLAGVLLLLSGAAVVALLDTTTLLLLVTLFAFGTAGYVLSAEPVPRSTVPLAALGLCTVFAGALVPQFWDGSSGAVLPVVTTLVLVGYVVFALGVGHALWFDGTPHTRRAGVSITLVVGAEPLLAVVALVPGVPRVVVLFGLLPLLVGASWLFAAFAVFPRGERDLPDATTH